MQLTVRSYLTAGVALAGAGIIAIAPIAPRLPDMQIAGSSAISDAAVQLSALSNPVTPWADLVGNTVNSVANLGTAWLADPAPLLAQVLRNQIGYGQLTATSLQAFVQGMVEWTTGDGYGALGPSLATMIDQLKAGDLVGVSETFNTAVIMMFLGGPAALMGLLSIPVQMATNLTAALTAVNSQVLYLGLSVIQNIAGVSDAIGASAQGVLDSLSAGNLAEAASGLIGMPAVVTNALLNGWYINEWTTMPGLLSDIPGQIPGLLPELFIHLPQAIAAAITPPVPEAFAAKVTAAAAAPAGVALPPAVTAETVTVDASPAPVVNEAPKPAETTGTPAATAPATPSDSTGPDTSAADPATTPGAETAGTPTDTKTGNKVTPGTRAGSAHKSGTGAGATLNGLGGGSKNALGGNHSSTTSGPRSGSGAGGSSAGSGAGSGSE